jgi:23S rRNA G2069 N7-methylase RlmK/C1962 C5-methylase RlmI
MARRKPADTVHLRLRFPEKLRRRIEAAAGKNQQSMNAEIVERLERSFVGEDMTAAIDEAAEAAVNRLVNPELEDLFRAYRRLSDDHVVKEYGDIAVQLVMEASPGLDEHAARERVASLVDKMEGPNDRRRSTLMRVLRFLRNEERIREIPAKLPSALIK